MGCVSHKPVVFTTGSQLLLAAKNIRLGHTRNDVVCYLGWRRDEGVYGPVYVPNDDPNGGDLVHPRLAFWRWQVYPVTLYVDFTDDGKVYRVRYHDDRLKPDGPYNMICPNQLLQRPVNAAGELRR